MGGVLDYTRYVMYTNDPGRVNRTRIPLFIATTGTTRVFEEDCPSRMAIAYACHSPGDSCSRRVGEANMQQNKTLQ